MKTFLPDPLVALSVHLGPQWPQVQKNWSGDLFGKIYDASVLNIIIDSTFSIKYNVPLCI